MNWDRLAFNATGGVIGAVLSFLYGGWTLTMTILLCIMCLDYVSGLCVAAFGLSKKSDSGGLNSAVGWRGLAKKIATLVLIAVVHIIGLTVPMAAGFFDAVVIAYICNETISLLENLGQLGVNLGPVQGMLDVLTKKSDVKNESAE